MTNVWLSADPTTPQSGTDTWKGFGKKLFLNVSPLGTRKSRPCRETYSHAHDLQAAQECYLAIVFTWGLQTKVNILLLITVPRSKPKMALMRDLFSQKPFPTLHPQSCLCLVHADRWGHHNADNADTTLRKPLARVPRQHLYSGRKNEWGTHKGLVKPLYTWEDLGRTQTSRAKEFNRLPEKFQQGWAVLAVGEGWSRMSGTWGFFSSTLEFKSPFQRNSDPQSILFWNMPYILPAPLLLIIEKFSLHPSLFTT